MYLPATYKNSLYIRYCLAKLIIICKSHNQKQKEIYDYILTKALKQTKKKKKTTTKGLQALYIQHYNYNYNACIFGQTAHDIKLLQAASTKNNGVVRYSLEATTRGGRGVVTHL